MLSEKHEKGICSGHKVTWGQSVSSRGEITAKPSSSFFGVIQRESEHHVQLLHASPINICPGSQVNDTDKNFGSSENGQVHLD